MKGLGATGGKEWNHSICIDCWNDRYPQNRTNMVARGPLSKVCCFCGKEHAGGIYVRERPNSPWLRCKGACQ